MFNKDFLKELTILCVEDDELIREQLFLSINDFFKEVIIAKDGKEALEKVLESEIKIDVIVSDISMPFMNGIEFLQNVRKIDKYIPFIFSTAFSDKEYLISAIKHGVSDFFVKPLDVMVLLEKIEKVCKKNKKEIEIINHQEMVQEYFNTINKVAIVYIYDLEGKILYINDFFKELSKYEDSDLIGENYTKIYHLDISKELIDKQEETLKSSEKFKGNLKYSTKDDSVFYVNCTTIPIKEKDEIKSFISVNFLTTKEENERREFKKKVLYNFQETKKIFKKAQEKVDELTFELSRYQNYDKKEKILKDLQIENAGYFEDIHLVEDKIKKIKARQDMFTFEINVKIKEISQSSHDLVEHSDKLDKKISKMSHEIILRDEFIKKLESEVEERSQKIINLEDVLLHRESQTSGKK
ncbi:MAG: response regulator [Aliarcobacter sp.]|nr:response regulator [Aliarcobacter sp.]